MVRPTYCFHCAYKVILSTLYNLPTNRLDISTMTPKASNIAETFGHGLLFHLACILDGIARRAVRLSYTF